MNPALTLLLLAVRSACQALVLTIDAVLDQDATPQPEEDAQGQCLHRLEHRVPAPVFGHPTRFVCKRCNRHCEEI